MLSSSIQVRRHRGSEPRKGHLLRHRRIGEHAREEPDFVQSARRSLGLLAAGVPRQEGGGAMATSPHDPHVALDPRTLRQGVRQLRRQLLRGHGRAAAAGGVRQDRRRTRGGRQRGAGGGALRLGRPPHQHVQTLHGLYGHVRRPPGSNNRRTRHLSGHQGAGGPIPRRDGGSGVGGRSLTRCRRGGDETPGAEDSATQLQEEV